MMIKISILLVSVIAVLVQETDCKIEQYSTISSEKLNQTIEMIQNNFNVSASLIDQTVNVILKKKCKKNNGSYDSVIKAAANLSQCILGVVDLNKLTEKLNKSDPIGLLNIVCPVWPTINKCVDDFALNFKTCLEPIEQESMEMTRYVTNDTINLGCDYKDSSLISLYFTHDGLECLRSKAPTIGQCATSIYRDRVPAYQGLNEEITKLSEMKELPLFVFDNKTCSAIEDFKTCAIASLNSCPESTSENLLNLIFSLIRSDTPCTDYE